LPNWLQTESYHIAGDTAETLHLLLPDGKETTDVPLRVLMRELKLLPTITEEERRSYITDRWLKLAGNERFVFNKLITGGFRAGVSAQIIIKAIARFAALEENVVAHQLSGKWDPDQTTLTELLHTGNDADISRPYPFCLAYPIEETPDTLGPAEDWIAEYKFDGIRGQIIVRNNTLFVWSRGEELLTDRIPEFHTLTSLLPNGTVIDGEILPVKEGTILPFHVMQTRIGRKNLTKKSLQEAPLAMYCYDLMEINGVDIRQRPLSERRQMLTALIDTVAPQAPLHVSPVVPFTNWQQAAQVRQNAREMQCEGLMLKRKSSEYRTGRRRGDWWKWKIDPLSIDAVLIYAQRGHGRRADMYTDYTFAVWNGGELVPFCKAYSGLTDKEMAEADAWIKKNTKEKFGPVRSVLPQLVFEIGFEGISPSPRHKSGISVRFPRMLRWRTDKQATDANSLEDLQGLLKMYGSNGAK
jgi:DNA ligase-1